MKSATRECFQLCRNSFSPNSAFILTIRSLPAPRCCAVRTRMGREAEDVSSRRTFPNEDDEREVLRSPSARTPFSAYFGMAQVAPNLGTPARSPYWLGPSSDRNTVARPHHGDVGIRAGRADRPQSCLGSPRHGSGARINRRRSAAPRTRCSIRLLRYTQLDLGQRLHFTYPGAFGELAGQSSCQASTGATQFRFVQWNAHAHRSRFRYLGFQVSERPDHHGRRLRQGRQPILRRLVARREHREFRCESAR